jgi:hypothetical protein
MGAGGGDGGGDGGDGGEEEGAAPTPAPISVFVPGGLDIGPAPVQDLATWSFQSSDGEA